MHLARIVIFALLLVGCTSLPNSESISKSTNIPKIFSHQDTLDSLGEKVIASKDFKEVFFILFPIPELQSLINEALEKNTDLLTLESKIKQAASNVKINSAALAPSISAGTNFNYSDRNYKNVQISYNQNSINANLSLNWEIDIFGKLDALRKASKQSYLAAKDSLKSAQISLIASVANYYFSILELEINLKNMRENLANLEQIAAITSQKHQLGLVDISEVASIQSTLFNTKNSILDLETQLEQNQNALSVLLNRQNPDYTFRAELIPFAIPKINALPQDVLLLRPDVQNSIHSLYAALYTKTNKKLALLPSFSVGGSLGQLLFSNSATGLVTQITSALSLPLLNRTSITQTYLIAKEDVKQAEYSLQNTINTAIQEINNASVNLRTSHQNALNATKNLDIATLNFKAIEVQYNQKLIDQVTFLNAQNTLISAKNSNISAIKAQNLAIITIYKVLAGNLYLSPSQNSLDTQKTQNTKGKK